VLISFVVMGLFSFRDLRRTFPKADPARSILRFSLPGATPEEMSTRVVLQLEAAVNDQWPDEITTVTSEGTAGNSAAFVLERDGEGAAWMSARRLLEP
jgi:multidrug efflux pump subunit AcrB